MKQYANSPRLQALVANLEAYFDPAASIDQFYNQIWNVDTANGYGLDIWGRIVGIGRYLTVEKKSAVFGFNVPSKSFTPFDVAPFKSGNTQTQTYRLDDKAYRRLVLAKAFANIVRPSAPALNRILQILFDGKRCYVRDTGNMTMQYVFCFFLEPFEKAIVLSDILPRPSGVKVSFVEYPLPNIFGFSEAESYAPFNYGTLYNTTEIS